MYVGTAVAVQELGDGGGGRFANPAGQILTVGDWNGTQGAEVVHIADAGDSDDGGASAHGQLRGDRTHTARGGTDDNDIVLVQVQLPECAARGLCSHTQAGRLREGQWSRLRDDVVGGCHQLGGECPAGVSLTGRTSQGTQHGIAHGEVGDVRTDGINDACEVAGHAPGKASGCALQPASRMKDALNPFKPS